MKTIFSYIVNSVYFMSSGELDIRISRVRFSLSSVCSIITSMIALSLILILPLYKTISDFLFACITMSIFVFLYWFFYKKYKRIFSYDNIKNSLSYNKPGNAILVTIFIFFFLVVCAFMFLGLFLLLIGLLAARDTW